MARKNAAQKAPLREKLQEAARKRGRPKGFWTPEIVRNRIKIGLIAARLENQALGEFDSRKRRGFDSPMTGAQLSAGLALLDKCIPKAVSPEETGKPTTINLIIRDPRIRPEGYQRKKAK